MHFLTYFLSPEVKAYTIFEGGGSLQAPSQEREKEAKGSRRLKCFIVMLSNLSLQTYNS